MFEEYEVKHLIWRHWLCS